MRSTSVGIGDGSTSVALFFKALGFGLDVECKVPAGRQCVSNPPYAGGAREIFFSIWSSTNDTLAPTQSNTMSATDHMSNFPKIWCSHKLCNHQIVYQDEEAIRQLKGPENWWSYRFVCAFATVGSTSVALYFALGSVTARLRLRSTSHWDL